MILRALIVDDEALARARLRKLLEVEAELEVIGEASNGPEAIAFLRAQRPDLVFLDVQMPEVSGLEVLQALPADQRPAAIFVTAHDEHAVQAFEAHALDYLLKPFTQARLHQAVAHARQHLETQHRAADNQRLLAWLHAAKPPPAYLSRIAVKNGRQTLFLKVEEVIYLESAANYVVVHTAAGNQVVRETLLNLEAALSPRQFLRISRSTLVNTRWVKGLQSNANGDALVVLHDDRQLLATRGLRELQQRLEYP